MSEQDVAAILGLYSSVGFRPPPSQYTVAASFFLTTATSGTKVISLATGTKCLPTSRFPARGEALHDSHAEVLARRGAIRWFLEEVCRCRSNSTYNSPWIYLRSDDGKYGLREGVQANLYISTLPCGDASTRLLASMQDEDMAALKDSTIFPELDAMQASRGRDHYSRLGVLRTKPGRADSPATLCMSCSDKIASWNVIGFQGALAASFLRPLYLSTIIIGEVPDHMHDAIGGDCQRALGGRLSGSVQGITALCWVADTLSHEVLINGMKRGVPPKHRYREKSRPMLSRAALLQLYFGTLELSGLHVAYDMTYRQAKESSIDYQKVKDRLIGVGGSFSGWMRSDRSWGNFTLGLEGAGVGN